MEPVASRQMPVIGSAHGLIHARAVQEMSSVAKSTGVQNSEALPLPGGRS